MPLQLRTIKYFCDVSRLHSFTEAARENFISQSAMSQQVKQLERDLGVTLLKRCGRSFELTPAGKHFALKATEILDALERLQGETVDIALGNPSALRIGYLASYDGWKVAEALAVFKQRHPYVQIDTFENSHDGLYNELRLRRADVIFNDKRRDLSEEYINSALMTCKEYIEISRAHSQAYSECATAQQLKSTPCIIIAAKEQEATEETFYRNVLNFECPVLFARTLQEARMMAAAGRGFVRIDAQNAASCAASALRRIPLVSENGQLTRDFYAFYPKQGANPLAADFTEVLKKICAKR